MRAQKPVLSMPRILVSTSSFNDSGALAALRGTGFDLVMNPHGRRLTEDEVIVLLDGVVGMVAGVEPLSRRVLEAAPALKIISRCGVGTDNVDLQAARERGIDVYNTPDAPVPAVTELTVGLMLSALRRITQADRDVRDGKWRPQMGRLLGSCAVGIVGYGRIGRKVAALVKAFGSKVLAHDVRRPAAEAGVEFCSLDRLLSFADVVTLHLPSGPENLHLIGKRQLALMRDGSVLVNTSRGDLVDEEALLAALASGKPAAAALDTFEHEPYRGPLCQMPQAVLTAHMGSYAVEARAIMEQEAVSNLVDGLAAHGLIAGATAKVGQRTTAAAKRKHHARR